MRRAERNKLLSAAVAKLEEASKLLKTAEEEVLSEQAKELADLCDVLTAVKAEAA